MLNTSFEPRFRFNQSQNVSHEWNQLLLQRECPSYAFSQGCLIGTSLLRFVVDEGAGDSYGCNNQGPVEQGCSYQPPWEQERQAVRAPGLPSLMSSLSCVSRWECRSRIASWKSPA